MYFHTFNCCLAEFKSSALYVLRRFTTPIALQQKLAAMYDLICITDALAALLARRRKLPAT